MSWNEGNEWKWADWMLYIKCYPMLSNALSNAIKYSIKCYWWLRNSGYLRGTSWSKFIVVVLPGIRQAVVSRSPPRPVLVSGQSCWKMCTWCTPTRGKWQVPNMSAGCQCSTASARMETKTSVRLPRRYSNCRLFRLNLPIPSGPKKDTSRDCKFQL